MKKHFLTLLLMLVFFCLAKAQKPIVTADTITYSIATQVPFDREFTFVFPLKRAIDISSISVFEFDTHFNDYESDDCCGTGSKHTSAKNYCASFCKQNLHYDFDGNKKNLYINVPPIKPGRYCYIVIGRKAFDEEAAVWYMLGKSITHDTSADFIQSKGMYEKMKSKLKDKDDPVSLPTFDSVNSFFCAQKRYYLKEDQLLETDNGVWKEQSPNFEKLHDSKSIKEFLRYLLSCGHCNDSIRYEYQIIKTDINKVISLLSFFESISAKQYDDLNKGLQTIPQSLLSEAVSEDNYSKRIENLSTTIKQIDSLVFILEYSIMRTDNTLEGFKNVLTAFELQLKTNLNLLNDLNSNFDAIKTSIQSDYRFNRSLASDGNTQTMNFIARNKLIITPDFGLIGYSNWQNNSQFANAKFSGILPYFGFHINLRPIDSDIPWRIYPRKTWLHYVSVFVGVSLVSIAKSNERYDFIGNSPMLVGMGLRLGHAVRAVGGAMLFFKDDPNPIITQKYFAAAPFLGISVDLRIKDLIGNVGQIFK